MILYSKQSCVIVHGMVCKMGPIPSKLKERSCDATGRAIHGELIQLRQVTTITSEIAAKPSKKYEN